jgi:hypothetical protein
MTNSKSSKEQLEKLVEEIKKDQSTEKPAEKRVKVDTTFNKAVKQMGQTQPPKKEAR